jgi:hypothetical protein
MSKVQNFFIGITVRSSGFTNSSLSKWEFGDKMYIEAETTTVKEMTIVETVSATGKPEVEVKIS